MKSIQDFKRAFKIRGGRRRTGGDVTPPVKTIVRSPTQRPPALQHAIHQGLETFDQLADRIGHRPHKDRLGGKWKMSKNYKAIKREIESIDDNFHDIGDQSLASFGSGNAFDRIDEHLDKLIHSAEAYSTQHSRDTDKQDAIRPTLETARGYKASLTAILEDPAFDKVKDHLTVRQALDIKRRGIAFKDCEFGTYSDDKEVSSDDDFGSGLANSVSQIVHGDGKPRVFKKEHAIDPKPLDGVSRIGIDPNAPHYGNRNIASHTMSNVLGVKAIGESRYAIHNGEVGLLMEMAPGKTPRRNVTRPVPDDNKLLLNAIQLGKTEKSGYSKDDSGKWQRTTKEMVKPWTTPPSPKAQASLQEQLNALEWCDMLTGQMDRHAENYLIDIQGDTVTVTGIDNDLCFGKKQDTIEATTKSDAYRGTGLPKLIDEKALIKLKAATFETDAAPSLVGLLSDEEIEAARLRFDAVKNHALKLEQDGFVVKDWATWRSPDDQTAAEFLNAQGDKTSLFKRDFAKFFSDDGLI